MQSVKVGNFELHVYVLSKGHGALQLLEQRFDLLVWTVTCHAILDALFLSSGVGKSKRFCE